MMMLVGKLLVYGRNVLPRLRTDERGANLVEYGFLIALIAIVAVAGVTLFGDELAAVWTSNGSTIANPNP